MFQIFLENLAYLLMVVLTTFGLRSQDKATIDKQVKNQKTFALVGYATLNYESSNGNGGFISATYNPIFVYKVNDKLSFNAELELEVEDS
ncbi:hypothetical protein SAMN05421636_104462 [Pricia antarctica]|uniref:Uncharacterized protein n=1 Tax=Pricia antarctica TaxID=641691 RepID=A0A1G7C8M5_9FLAO|nr:hypothetical protein [Pricia antarctica]SDE35667.1 hypothetical protein SAMN05421636_104462 [Pricia antarctica]